MSPKKQNRGRGVSASNNLYTVILALAFCVVLATATFVALSCYIKYDTVFAIIP